MPITKSNAADALAAVRRLSENAVNNPSRAIRTVPVVAFTAPPAPKEEIVVFRYANFKKEVV